MSHLPKSVFKTSHIAALGTRLTCSINTICRSQLQSSGLAHAWARYGIGIHRAHTQLNRFYFESILCITCVTSCTRPSSRFFACNVKKLGERAWGQGYSNKCINKYIYIYIYIYIHRFRFLVYLGLTQAHPE